MLISIGGALFGYSAPFHSRSLQLNLSSLEICTMGPITTMIAELEAAFVRTEVLVVRRGMLNRKVFIFKVDGIEST
jgi:hypothetical protein